MIFVVLLAFLLAANAKQFTVEVQGRFNCSTLHQNVPVYMELRERDLVRDDLLGWTNVMPQNFFHLKGTEYELLNIDPYLVIMHGCKGHPEKTVVNIGHIYKDTVIEFGDQDLADPTLQKKMEDKINVQLAIYIALKSNYKYSLSANKGLGSDTNWLEHQEKVVVNFGHIDSDVFIDFGEQFLDDPEFQKKLEDIVNKSI
ncbi:Transthyretin-like family protein, partial [Ostertagia ostertagi]